jgi:transposase
MISVRSIEALFQVSITNKSPFRRKRILRYHLSSRNPVVHFETDPGEQMQVDWGVIRCGKKQISAFVATLD